MIDPILSLAFSAHSNRGVYVLLLGSGVSRSAEVPTGWEIVLDLIRQLAHVSGKDCEPDPAGWYKAEYGKDPDYSELLDLLVGTPAERNQLLRSYFEPTPEEREMGRKVPTDAHKAIAELVAAGFVKVILTTNFDRLMEEALAAVGIVPTVIATPDAAEGALPLVHTQCTVIKLHGDYLDTRIKNTPAELAAYDVRIDILLDRILDEYGLIVCGWSAEWDTALRAAIERCKNHRFSTYWATVCRPGSSADRLASLRRGQFISIPGADVFFPQLKEKILALETFGHRHPLSEKVAIANLKKYIAEDRHRILLHDLVMEEAENVYSKMMSAEFPIGGIFPNATTVPLRAKNYEAISEVLLSIMVHGCYWGKEQQEDLWAKCIERLANTDQPMGTYYEVWLNMSRYPALLMLYGGGIAAMASGNYGTLARLLAKPRITRGSEDVPAFSRLYPSAVMSEEIGHLFPGREREYTPLSEIVYSFLRPKLEAVVPQDAVYDLLFDKFEYLLALVVADHREKIGGRILGPPGRFGWNRRDFANDICYRQIRMEIQKTDPNPLLSAGFFEGTIQRANKIIDGVTMMMGEVPWY